MDTAPDQTPQLHDSEHISEPASPTTRFLLIILCLVGCLSIAYYQVINSSREVLKENDSSTKAQKVLRILRLILLNAISGILLMIATSIGMQESSLAAFEADFHSLLDPQTTQIKIDCIRIHVTRWIQYSSGWQIFSNLAQHAHNLHLWVLSLEYLVALVLFIILVVLDDSRQKMKWKATLISGAFVHACFPSYWLLWWPLALQLTLFNSGPRIPRAPLLPLFDPKSRKSSRPSEAGNSTSKARRVWTSVVGLYLLSANLYGVGEGRGPKG